MINDQSEVQFWACFPLVMYEGDPEAVEVAIDLVGKASRGSSASRHPGEILMLMLRDRFAENFFWDTAAWKRWWAEQQKQSTTPASGALPPGRLSPPDARDRMQCSAGSAGLG